MKGFISSEKAKQTEKTGKREREKRKTRKRLT
jgi:hypothetical protein